MIKKLIPCPWCNEMVAGEGWAGGSIKIFEHKGHYEEYACHFRLVLENRRDGGEPNVADNR